MLCFSLLLIIVFFDSDLADRDLANSLHADEATVFYEFEHSAAACGDEADLFGFTELVQCGDGIASADEGKRASVGSLYYGFGYGVCTVGEVCHFKNAHWPVPENGFCGEYSGRKFGSCYIAYI